MCNDSNSSYHGMIAIVRESVSSDNTINLKDDFNDMQSARKPTTLRSSERRASGAARRNEHGNRASRSGTRGRSATSSVAGSPLSNQDGDGAEFYRPELIRRRMETSDDIITSDGHSTVLRSWNGDMEVAVKY